jgi:hypothetical protein
MLEGSTNPEFNGEVELGEVVGDSTFVGEAISRGGASAIPLCTAVVRSFAGPLKW